MATAADGEQAIVQVQKHRPDLVLMDIRMPRCDGLTATRLIKARMPEMRIVMLTTSAEDDDLFESIRSGACGYLLKSMGGDEFAASLLALGEGIPPFSPGLAQKVLREFARRSVEIGKAPADEASAPALTDRQTQVLRAVAGGLTYKEVGASLGLSERTVRYHMAEIMNALHLANQSQVIAYAGRMGLNPQNS